MTESELLNYKLEGTELDIVTYPDPVLSKIAGPVTEFNDELAELCKNMLYTMYHAPGIGLAAPQIGISKRLFVMDVDYDREEIDRPDGTTEYRPHGFNPRILINPVFVEKDGETTYQEGCLSVPGVYEDVKRAKQVVVEYQDILGEKKTLEADGLLAICMQHENDHLDGIVFIEKLSKFKFNFFRQKLNKLKVREQS